MGGQQLSRAAIEAYLLVNTDVYLGEVLTVEVGLQHLAVFIDTLFAQLLLRAKDKPGSIKLLVLRRDGLRLLRGLFLQGSHVVIEVCHLLMQLVNLNVLGL